MPSSSRVPRFLLALSLALLAGCATTGEVATAPSGVPAAEEKPEHSARLGALNFEWVARVERGLKLLRAPEVEELLRDLALRLGAPPETGVVVFTGGLPGGARRASFAVPGARGSGRIYVAREALLALEAESEWGAVLALELSLLASGEAVRRLPPEIVTPTFAALPGDPLAVRAYDAAWGRVDFFGSGGIFDFPEAAWSVATTDAVPRLYRAGLDPRGLARWWTLAAVEGDAARNASVAAAFDHDEASRLAETSRKLVSKEAPLLNPIVRSDRFRRARERLR